MSAGPEGRAPGPAISSPELALVDPELRALAGDHAHTPPSGVRPDAADVVRPAAAPVSDRGSTEPPVPDGDVTRAPAADGDLTEAMRRLAELADVDPPEQRSRSTRVLGISFAATAWLVLAFVVADMQLWRL